MQERLLKILETLGSGSVLLVGDFMLDRYVMGDIDRISPEAPVPVMKAVKRKSQPGGAGLVAADIRAMGGRVMCVGVAGQDDAGAELCRQLSVAGANVKHLLTLPGRGTTVKERYIGLAQHRHSQQILRVDYENASAFPQVIEQQVLASIKELIGQADVVCLEDYGKGLLSSKVCQETIDLARKAGKPVLVDPARTADYSKYFGADVVTPNRFEAGLVGGVEISDEQMLHEAASRLIDKWQFQAVVITLDKEGAYLLEKGQSGRLLGTRPREVYDVTGAGDVVLATMAVALAGGCNLADAVALANLAGGLAVEKPGAATVSRQEILAELLASRIESLGKILTAKHAKQELERYRHNGKKIVFTNGCFDVLHMGHVSLLAKAREMGDVLVVGLNSDESIRANKGPDRPVCSEQQRASVLAGLESVDYVVIFNENEPIRLLDMLRPDILVKGEDCIERGVVGRELVEGYGGQVKLVPMVAGCSTTNIIQTILQKYSARKPSGAQRKGQ